GPQPGAEDRLGPRAELDGPRPVAIAHLVVQRAIAPNGAGHVQIARTHRDYFAGPHPREALELDHLPDLAGDMGLDRLDERVGDGPDRLGLPGRRPPALEARDRLERVEHFGRDQLLRGGPLEHADNATDPGVDAWAGKPVRDHPLPDLLQPLGPE